MADTPVMPNIEIGETRFLADGAHAIRAIDRLFRWRSIARPAPAAATYWLGLLAAASSAPVAARLPGNLSRYVDTRIGNGNDNQGDTIIGPALPAGSIHPSPETLIGSNAGYAPDQPISGFAQLHVQGAGGVTTYGNFLVSPQIGKPLFDEAAHLSGKANERAGATFYSVTLTRYRTHVAIVPRREAALYTFDFPSNSTPDLVFDVTRKIGGSVGSAASDVTINPESGMITGRVRAKGYWSPALVDIWFAAKVDHLPSSWGIFAGDKKRARETRGTAGADRRLGAWLQFAPARAAHVKMKIAVSFTSAKKARQLLDENFPGWDAAAARVSGEHRWNEALSRITIDGVGDADKRRFYTALYHTYIQPHDRSRDRPDSDGGAPFWDDYYTLWDSYRTAFPLMSLIRRADYAGNVRSMIRTYQRYGAVDTAFIAGRNYRVGQGGDETDNVLGEALLRHVPGIDWRQASRVALHNAWSQRSPRYLKQGYFADGDRSPEPDNQRARSGSSTLAFSINDFYDALLASKAGLPDQARLLARRSENWRKVWDSTATSEGFRGFIEPRYPDRRFRSLDPEAGWDGKTYDNLGFYEGTSWIYSFGILQDLPGMVAAMGGRRRFQQRLSYALSSGLIDISNEPSFQTPWLFIEIGRPDLASYWADQLFRRFTADAYPGDEDNGAMSSAYVFNRIGLYPKLCSGLFYVHAPHQPLATIHLESGRTFKIVAHHWAKNAIYIRAARLNGKPLDHAWLSQAEILAGGTLDLDVGAFPDHWGRAQALLDHEPDTAKLIKNITTSSIDHSKSKGENHES